LVFILLGSTEGEEWSSAIAISFSISPGGVVFVVAVAILSCFVSLRPKVGSGAAQRTHWNTLVCLRNINDVTRSDANGGLAERLFDVSRWRSSR
jgi:hypothetical protein